MPRAQLPRDNDIDEWFYKKCPGLASRVMSLAWEHRHERPVINVMTSAGGDDATAPKVTAEPWNTWQNYDGVAPMEFTHQLRTAYRCDED
jgi:hypothetical protein